MTASVRCLAWLLAACNSHPGFPNEVPDARSGDAPSTTPDAAPDGVAVTVTLRGAPAPGVAVYFQSADSSLAVSATTDNHGTASAVLAAGGYVTVIEPADGTGATRLATFAAVQPGDALHLDLEPTGPTDETTLTVTVPTMEGAASYQLDTSCGQFFADASGAASGALLGCGDAADIVVAAVDPTSVILGSLYAADVPVGGPPATLSGRYGAPVATTFAYTGVPASSDAVRTLQMITTARGILFSVSTSAAVANGQVTSSLDMPAAPGAVAVTVSEALPASTDLGEQRIFDWGSPSSAYTLDIAAAMLPPFTSAPTYDLAARSVSWVESGGAAANLVRATVHTFRDAIPEGKSWTWAIVAPRSAGAGVTFPRFPPGGFDYTPQAGDVIGVADLLIADVPLGYDGVRAHGFDLVQRYVTGSSGHLVVETLYSPPL